MRGVLERVGVDLGKIEQGTFLQEITNKQLAKNIQKKPVSKLPQFPPKAPAWVKRLSVKPSPQGAKAATKPVPSVNPAAPKKGSRVPQASQAPSVDQTKPTKQRPDMGEYRHTRGHHVYSKKAFEGHVNYDPQKGFSISEEFMVKNGISHRRVTTAQMKLFNELSKSCRSNTLKEHTRIAVKALEEGGATNEQAREIVAGALRHLKNQGIKNPMIIPWNK